MPRPNRVTPEGVVVAIPARGLMMGNRGGVLHQPDRTLSRRRWVSRRWIVCLLAFRGRRRQIMAPGRYTELFFLDEATALAAGHRPCFECRRAEARQFAASLSTGLSRPGKPLPADAIDLILHRDRLDGAGCQARHTTAIDTLPTGAMILWRSEPHLVVGAKLWRWSPTGYGPAEMMPPRSTAVTVLTPRATVAALQAGYAPLLHPSAEG